MSNLWNEPRSVLETNVQTFLDENMNLYLHHQQNAELGDHVCVEPRHVACHVRTVDRQKMRHLSYVQSSHISQCTLRQARTYPLRYNGPKKKSFVPAKPCRHNIVETTPPRARISCSKSLGKNTRIIEGTRKISSMGLSFDRTMARCAINSQCPCYCIHINHHPAE